MSTEEQTRFLKELADDLNSRNIQLPSFPDVVVNIRTALEDPSCTAENLAAVVQTDAVLVARLLMSANSAFHNRAGIEITDLNLAISRLGFEVVRNTAISLTVEQIFSATEHADYKDLIGTIWDTSLSLASMSFVIARKSGAVNPDNAFLSGLMHEIGKLYLLTKAREFPLLMGDTNSLHQILEDWYGSVGKSIIQSWGFSADIADSVETDDNLSNDADTPATTVDVVYMAKQVLEGDEESPIADAAATSANKLSINNDNLPGLREAYELHSQSMRQSVSG